MRRSVICTCITIAGLALAACAASAAEFHVAATGDGANPGTADQPCATLEHVKLQIDNLVEEMDAPGEYALEPARNRILILHIDSMTAAAAIIVLVSAPPHWPATSPQLNQTVISAD